MLLNFLSKCNGGEKAVVKWEIKPPFTEYKCDKCGKTLAVEHELGDVFYINDCEHYYWEIMTVTCYYERYEECDPDYIKELEGNAVLIVSDTSDVYFLLPRRK